MIRSAVFLFLVGALIFLQPNAAWSVHHLRGLALLPVLLGGLLIVLMFVKRLPDHCAGFLDRPFDGRFFRISSLVLVAASAALLVFFRFRLFLPPPQGSGDSLLLLEHVPAYSRIFGFLDSFDEVLDLFVHSRMYLAAYPRGFFVEDVYAWTSFAAGFAYTAGLLFFLRGRPVRDVLLGVALLYFTPALQLYAGYVENYSLAAVCVNLVLFASVRLIENSEAVGLQQDEPPGSPAASSTVRPILIIAATAACGALFHLLGSPVLFALMYLVWVLSGRSLRRFAVWGLYASGAALLVLVPVWTYFLALVENPVSFGTSFTASPAILRPGKFFSVRHGLDLLNLLLFASPAGVLLLAGGLLRWSAISSHRGGRIRRFAATLSETLGGPPGIFLGVAFATYFIHASIWNSHIGFPADWDLFTFFQAPLNLLVFHIAARRRPSEPVEDARRWTAALLFGIFFSTPWLHRNASASEASQRYKEKARANVEELVGQIEADPVFPGIQGLSEKRNYVKVKLFRIRSLRSLVDDSRPESVKRILRSDLEKAVSEYERLITTPSISSASKKKAVWDELTRLNLEIHSAGE